MPKPTCKLTNQNGNIFHLIGIASRALKKEGVHAEAKELQEKCCSAKSYEEALQIIRTYVSVE